MAIKGRIYTKFKENPFVEKATEDAMVIRKKTQVMRTSNKDEIQMIVNSQSEVEGHSAFMRFVEVDEYYSLLSCILVNPLLTFWDLSKASMRAFFHIE